MLIDFESVLTRYHRIDTCYIYQVQSRHYPSYLVFFCAHRLKYSVLT